MDVTGALMLNKLNFKQQLTVLLSSVVVAMLVLIGLPLWGMQRLSANVETLYQSGAKPIRALGELASRLPRMRVGVDVMFLEEVGMGGDKNVAIRVKETREEDMPAMRQAVELAVKAQIIPKRVEQLGEIQKAYVLMEKESIAPMLDALAAGRTAEAKSLYLGPYTKHYRTVRDQINKALDELVDDAAAGVEGEDVAHPGRARARRSGDENGPGRGHGHPSPLAVPGRRAIKMPDGPSIITPLPRHLAHPVPDVQSTRTPANCKGGVPQCSIHPPPRSC